jgi:hypothetical protein
MLMAIRLDGVKIGGREAGTLVAFTADGLGMDTEYQALAGGAV